MYLAGVLYVLDCDFRHSSMFARRFKSFPQIFASTCINLVNRIGRIQSCPLLNFSTWFSTKQIQKCSQSGDYGDLLNG